MRLVLGITGATGSIIGVRILRALRDLGVETHLVLSRWGRATLGMETDISPADLHRLADVVHGAGDHSAPISSGSFHTDGMIIAPCSMKTLAAVRGGYGDGLIARAADVTIKERRRLVLVPRELPVSEIHLDNMLGLARMGVVIAPPVPAFYTRPTTVEEIVTHIAARVLDQFGLELPGAVRWQGPPTSVNVPGFEAPHDPGTVNGVDAAARLSRPGP
ncbi:4-hydroxy-3-polyprenylbenzoate decarboxylase [Saccharothrix ecbatanensis]|uniref:Flavin prenyltransferase UbiX n=1 Tax=Saccharothrix ecbatanensis TaxID=1105145 RepID=A0A7W9HHN4_9PSEU|nr:UbiX family flavin prenyltransferase [Saccharothrix ecbatanensis]MBB5802216.1 4-hydroxy-3-polyprenylbenzoate decarboxylase [Saccharothrix ecbatanensis]